MKHTVNYVVSSVPQSLNLEYLHSTEQARKLLILLILTSLFESNF